MKKWILILACVVIFCAGCGVGGGGNNPSELGGVESGKGETDVEQLDKNFVFVQGGTFTMGCTQEQGNDCFDDEKPAHGVTVGDFQIGKYEVTQGLWKAVMGNNPSNFTGDDNLPVEQVSWNDVQEFIGKLNIKTGKIYRLPTEAEWEYAARGGNQSSGYKYSGSNTIGDVAWYMVNSGDKHIDDYDFRTMKDEDVKALVERIKSNKNKTHPVGTKHSNELGIYDMTGNVWEWVNDWYGENYYGSSPAANPKGPETGSSRVNRGGSWNSGAEFARVSVRGIGDPGFRPVNLGFRLALRSK